MKVGLYPGSFNPWHIGHQDILEQALVLYDKVIVLMCQNPEKATNESIGKLYAEQGPKICKGRDSVQVDLWTSTLKSYLEKRKEEAPEEEVVGMIRGLRNGMDLEYEIAQKGIHEDTDLGLTFTCFLTARDKGHISSSAVRGLNRLGLEHGYTTF